MEITRSLVLCVTLVNIGPLYVKLEDDNVHFRKHVLLLNKNE